MTSENKVEQENNKPQKVPGTNLYSENFPQPELADHRDIKSDAPFSESEIKSEANPFIQPLSIFCFGTGQTREGSKVSKQNIIDDLSEGCSSAKVIIDGPNVFGTQVQKNTEDAVLQILKWLENAQAVNNKYIINIAGFSRGGAMCNRIANRVQDMVEGTIPFPPSCNNEVRKKLKEISFRIFAIDPVAGHTDKRHKAVQVIPKNVEEYTATLQQHELRLDFKPTDYSRLQVQNRNEKNETKPLTLTLLPFPSRHNHTTTYDEENGVPLTNQMGCMLKRFFQNGGTVFDDKKLQGINPSRGWAQPPLGPQDLLVEDLKRYQEIHLKNEGSTYRDASYYVASIRGLLPSGARTFNENLEDYVTDSGFFQNQHERELFKVVYPEVFNYFFEHAVGHTGQSPENDAVYKEAVKAQILVIHQQIPDLYNRLNKNFFLKGGGLKGELGEPQGGFRKEKCLYIRTVYPDDDRVKNLENLETLDDDFNKLHNLEQEVREVTYFYERHKHGWQWLDTLMPFSESPHKKHALEIRTGMREILQSNQTDEVKHENILELLTIHYRELALNNISGRFGRALEQILNKNHYEGKVTPSNFYWPLWFLVKTLNGTRRLFGFIYNIIGVALTCLYIIPFVFRAFFGFGAVSGRLDRLGRGMDIYLGYSLFYIMKALKFVTFQKAVGWIGRQCNGYGIKVEKLDNGVTGEPIHDRLSGKNKILLAVITILFLTSMMILTAYGLPFMLTAFNMPVPAVLQGLSDILALIIKPVMANLKLISLGVGSMTGLIGIKLLFQKKRSSLMHVSMGFNLLVSATALTLLIISLFSPLPALLPYIIGVATLVSFVCTPFFSSSESRVEAGRLDRANDQGHMKMGWLYRCLRKRNPNFNNELGVSLLAHDSQSSGRNSLGAVSSPAFFQPQNSGSVGSSSARALKAGKPSTNHNTPSPGSR